MNSKIKTIMNSQEILDSLNDIVQQIIEMRSNIDDMLLIGILTRGYRLAERIANQIHIQTSTKVPVGSLDITLYRDDEPQAIANKPVLKDIFLPFDITNKNIILVDDVLYTGRTAQRAIDRIMDEGRPQKIELAILIDRGLRELPISADYFGKRIEIAKDEFIIVKLKEIDGEDLVISTTDKRHYREIKAIARKGKKIKKIVLAYSGGLDTSVIIPWLKEHYDCEIIAFAADLGMVKLKAQFMQNDQRVKVIQQEKEYLEKKALESGASQFIFADLKEEFVKNYIFPALKADVIYEGKYMLATALGRPLISQKMVEIAEKEGAEAVAHGSSGKGNDQVRFDVSVKALNPDIKIIAPLRHWELKSRIEEIKYAQDRGIPITATKESPYSMDWNLWGLSIECGVLEDPWNEPPEDIYQITRSLQDTTDKPMTIDITFEKGIPTEINGTSLNAVDLIFELNYLGGIHGIGRVDLVENRLVGIKSREIYEAPAATILHIAHKELENLIMDRELLHFKEIIASKYSELVYYGLWFSPLRESLAAFVEDTQKDISGTVKLKLFKGRCIPLGRKSEYSLYDYKFATYDENDAFDHKAGEAFCEIWGLPYELKARIKQKNKN
ncbi:MAG: argininosuccinate synthase [Candidatus Hodarchaeota archaeon]